MDEGLLQLLFIGFFILISVADAIAKARKKRGGEAEVEDETVRSSAPKPEYTRPHGTTDGDDEEEAEPARVGSSESMVPNELWEEIAQLARGDRREPEPAPLPEVVTAPAEVDESRMGRMSRASSGMPKIERRLSYDERALLRQRRGEPLVPDEPTKQIAPVPGSGGTVPKRGPRHWLSSEGSGASALRRAVVIREVLGPPVALRKGGFPVED